MAPSGENEPLSRGSLVKNSATSCLDVTSQRASVSIEGTTTLLRSGEIADQPPPKFMGKTNDEPFSNSGASNKKALKSVPEVAMNFPSRENATDQASLKCVFTFCNSSPVCASKTLTVRSELADAIVELSGEKARLLIFASC